MVIAPELADVLSAIICRIRGADEAVPLVVAYDIHERVWNPPMPLLFQLQIGIEHRPIPIHGIRALLNAALAGTGLTDASGKPLTFTPHDFRRLFITEAVLNGMPPHIAQLVAGHADISATMGYTAVYPEEVINAHRAFIARRRATGRARNTASPPTSNETNSPATSNGARSPSATAAGPTGPAACTSTAVSGAPSFALTQLSGHGWKASATT